MFSKSAPREVCALIILSVSSINVGINLSAILIIITRADIGTFNFFNGASNNSRPPVKTVGVVVKVKREVPRIRRIILCAFLGIKKENVLAPVPYIRVLGFNEKGAGILKKAKDIAALPIVTKSSEINALGEDAKRVFELECFARDMLSLAHPRRDEFGKEMTDKLIVL